MKLRQSLISIICSIFISSFTFGKGIAINPIKEAEDSDHFYAVLDQIAYIPGFQISSADAAKYATKKSKRILKIPVNVLMYKFDFGKEETISVADLENEKVYQYEVKDYVFALYFDDPETSSFSNTSLILSNDPKVHEKLAKEMLLRPLMTGLAYWGTKRKMRSFNVDLIQLDDAPKNDPLYKTNFFKTIKPSVIKKGNVYSYDLIVYPSVIANNPYETRFTFFFKSKDGTYEGFRRDTYLDKGGNSLRAYDIFEGMKIFRVFDDWNGRTNSAQYLILCSPEKLELLTLGSFND